MDLRRAIDIEVVVRKYREIFGQEAMLCAHVWIDDASLESYVVGTEGGHN